MQLIKCASSVWSVWLQPIHLPFSLFFPPAYGLHRSASSKVLMFDTPPPFFFSFSSPRGAGGGDGESRDAGSPGETETPAQTQRALPFSPAGVFTSHTHQVHFICVTGLDALFTFFLWDLLVQLLNPPTYLTFYFGFKYPSHAVIEVLFTKCFFIFSSKSFGLQLIQQTQLFLQTEHF